jgi:Flp pilus assembly protein TadG
MLESENRKTPRKGAALVETAIVIGACLLFLFAIFEYGRFVMIRHLLDNAAREGARLAVANTNTLATSDIQNTVTNYLAGQPVTLSSFSCYMANPDTGASIGAWTDASFGQAIAVDLQVSYNPIFPSFGFLPSTVVMKTKVIMRSEAN